MTSAGWRRLFRTDTRQLARSDRPNSRPTFAAADPVAALKAFHDGAWRDPAATMMGSEQEDWLAHALARVGAARAALAGGRRSAR